MMDPTDPWERDERGDGGPEYEDEDFCEEHKCWKDYCRDDEHEDAS